MHLRGQVPRGRGPIPQRHRYGDDPLPRRYPGHNTFDQVRRGLGHAPARTGGTKSPSLTAEGQQDLLIAGLTSQAQEPTGQDATLEILVKLALHVVGQAFGVGIVVKRGEKGLQVFRDHVVEHGAARIAGFVGGNSWRHESTHVQHCGDRGDKKCRRLYCTYEHYSRKITSAALPPA